VRCLSCKYDLKNLAEHRCPECGRAFDPNDARTFDTRSSARLRAARHFVIRFAETLAVTWIAVFLMTGLTIPGQMTMGDVTVIALIFTAVVTPFLLVQLAVSLMAAPGESVRDHS
jgi:hypothetical protein